MGKNHVNVVKMSKKTAQIVEKCYKCVNFEVKTGLMRPNLEKNLQIFCVQNVPLTKLRNLNLGFDG